jgi:hypothetical protein
MLGLLCNTGDLAFPAFRTNPFVQVRIRRWIPHFRRACTYHALDVLAFGIFERSRHLPSCYTRRRLHAINEGALCAFRMRDYNPSVTGVRLDPYWTSAASTSYHSGITGERLESNSRVVFTACSAPRRTRGNPLAKYVKSWHGSAGDDALLDITLAVI